MPPPTLANPNPRSPTPPQIGRVAAGAIAEKWLAEQFGVEIVAWVSGVGAEKVTDVDAATITRLEVEQTVPLRCVPCPALPCPSCPLSYPLPCPALVALPCPALFGVSALCADARPPPLIPPIPHRRHGPFHTHTHTHTYTHTHPHPHPLPASCQPPRPPEVWSTLVYLGLLGPPWSTLRAC